MSDERTGDAGAETRVAEADDLLEELLGRAPEQARARFWRKQVSILSAVLVFLGVSVVAIVAFWLGTRINDDSALRAQATQQATGDNETTGSETGTSDTTTTSTPQADTAPAGPESTTTTGEAWLSATLQSGRFELRGAVPDETIATRVRETAAIVYGQNQVDELTIDLSLPEPSWADPVADAIASLPIISNGGFDLAGDSLTIRGVAGSVTKQQQFSGALQQLLGPGIKVIDEVDVVEKPAPSLQIRKSSESTIELSGVLPDEQLGSTIEQVLAAVYPGHEIESDFTFDSAVEETFALYSLPTFAGLFAEFPAWEVSYVSETLQSSSSGAASFASNSAELPPAGARILDSFAAGMGGIPGLTLIIEGHTDSVGDASYNLQLSERRAQAVVDYLTTNHGIDPKRLTAVGQGESRPIADNGTSEGRTRNRRVDFVIEFPGL